MVTHAVIDLETYGQDPDAVVLTVGAVKFDPFTSKKPYDEFYHRLDINAQLELERTTSQATEDWWAKQPNEAIMEAFHDDDRIDPADMLRALRKWYVGVEIIWAQGAHFDIVILENLCKMYKVPEPWAFWQVHCSRPIFRLMSTDPRRKYKSLRHHALEDCKIQARSIQDVYKYLGITQ